MAEFLMGLGAGTYLGWYLAHVLREKADPRALDFFRTTTPDSGVRSLYPEAVDTELYGPDTAA